MKVIEAKMPAKLEETVEIEFFADLHIGSKKCNMELINERVERVKNNDNVYCVLLGDIINNSTKSSVGDVYDEPLSPMEQMKLACSLFEPIKHKILAITAGNHERRSYKGDGTDLTWFLARQLGCEDKYDYAACVLCIKYGKAPRNTGYTTYTMYLTHGDGQGGMTMGAKANGLQRRGHIIDADIIVTGHTHQPLTFRNTSFKIVTAGTHPRVLTHEQVFVNLASTLNYEEYAELRGMQPSSVKNPVVVLTHGNKQIDVKL